MLKITKETWYENEFKDIETFNKPIAKKPETDVTKVISKSKSSAVKSSKPIKKAKKAGKVVGNTQVVAKIS